MPPNPLYMRSLNARSQQLKQKLAQLNLNKTDNTNSIKLNSEANANNANVQANTTQTTTHHDSAEITEKPGVAPGTIRGPYKKRKKVDKENDS